MRLAGLFASAGVVVCLVLIAVWKASAVAQLWTVSDAVARIMLVLWPVSFGLMALQPGSTTADVILIYAVLILVNAVLYGLVGAIVGTLVKLGRRAS